MRIYNLCFAVRSLKIGADFFYVGLDDKVLLDRNEYNTEIVYGLLDN